MPVTGLPSLSGSRWEPVFCDCSTTVPVLSPLSAQEITFHAVLVEEPPEDLPSMYTRIPAGKERQSKGIFVELVTLTDQLEPLLWPEEINQQALLIGEYWRARTEGAMSSNPEWRRRVEMVLDRLTLLAIRKSYRPFWTASHCLISMS